MSSRFTNGLAIAMATAAKTALDGGFLMFFSGPVPADAAGATTGATKLATLTESGDTATGLTFDAPSGAALSKKSTETWSGVIATAGTASFFRFCPSGDDGTAAVTTPRLQGPVGNLSSSADARLVNPALVASEELSIDSFNVRLTTFG